MLPANTLVRDASQGSHYHEGLRDPTIGSCITRTSNSSNIVLQYSSDNTVVDGCREISQLSRYFVLNLAMRLGRGLIEQGMVRMNTSILRVLIIRRVSHVRAKRLVFFLTAAASASTAALLGTRLALILDADRTGRGLPS